MSAPCALPPQVLGCLTLFMTANLLKVLFAKMMARKFNQHSHYAKMHQALKRVRPGRRRDRASTGSPARAAALSDACSALLPSACAAAAAARPPWKLHAPARHPVQEYLLHTLLQPRQNYAELEDLEGEELEDEEGEGDMERVHSGETTVPCSGGQQQGQPSASRFRMQPQGGSGTGQAKASEQGVHRVFTGAGSKLSAWQQLHPSSRN